MTPGELLTEWRRKVFDTVAPYLWSQEEFLSYLDEAQKVFIRGIGGVVDRTSPLRKVVVKAGSNTVALDELILDVERAAIVGLDELRRVGANRIGMEVYNGSPSLFALDAADGVLLLDKSVDADTTIIMQVRRMPLDDVTTTGDELEVPSRYHRALLEYVTALAYRKPDPETQDKEASARAEQNFALHLEGAKREMSRLREPVRTVSYGGL